jgi:hypothetical protein
VLLPGVKAVPVTMGDGLTPGDAISVEPKGMPVGEIVELVVIPSGEVAPMLGVGLTIPLTCALAGLQTASHGRSAAIKAAALIRVLRMALLFWCDWFLWSEDGPLVRPGQLNTHLWF